MRRKSYALASLAAVAALSAGSAWAYWPASIVGTWTAVANQTGVQLVIQQQGAVGHCRDIAGTITDVSPPGQSNPIQGWYCPATGRFNFLRKNSANNDTFQVYSGNLSDDGAVLRMGGVFSQEGNGTQAHSGEYNFSATMRKSTSG
jgi:hypothetical protein